MDNKNLHLGGNNELLLNSLNKQAIKGLYSHFN